MAERFYLWFCPYLPLGSSVEWAEWRLAPLVAFNGPWASPTFQDAAVRFLQRFTDADGKMVHPALLVHREHGANGEAPSEEVYRALQRALEFAAIDTNPRWSDDALTNGWRTLTADNAALFVWPLDPAKNHVALERGGLRWHVMGGGFWLDKGDWQVRCPLEVPSPMDARLDEEMLTAVYEVSQIATKTESRAVHARRILTAIDWLSHSWRNSPSLTEATHVVLLKVGFEALCSGSETNGSSHKEAAELRKICESVKEELDWYPANDTRMAWISRSGKTSQVTPLEHWYLSMADVRNTIIHEGRAPDLSYVQAGSVFDGPYVWTGEWLLRTAIKIRLQQFGFTDLWLPAFDRIGARLIRDFPSLDT